MGMEVAMLVPHLNNLFWLAHLQQGREFAA
jgi:hypothetical protein